MARKKHSTGVLKKKIKYLEEELVRKVQEIEQLKKENLILFKTALKQAQQKIEKKTKKTKFKNEF